MSAIEDAAELREALFSVAFNTSGQDFYPQTCTELAALIKSREQEAEKRGASKAATAINSELGLDLTDDGSYYLGRYERLHAQQSNQGDTI
ncbi:hypothetical protein QM806_04455 [Rhodococcus sp. IEGM 1351]|uniref:hypothetical protein n=1 Tax=Rhodococcus sp. IEGM 1351 TaxID=3047089 RepID=UPI0024B681FB|nr:hypothetical protein [Rhodococcus sp. IEGM 1351]MDI9934706.1 hypothetical protein [Rhodococcus sp. IEGM 1351]